MTRRCPLDLAIHCALWCATLLCNVVHADATTIHATLALEFDLHPLLMLGELHRRREIHAFLQGLLRDPAFICRADDVVVEFGNSRLQALADRYVLERAEVSEAQLASLWRETAPPLTWNSPLYRAVYVTLREINTRRLCPHPVRVLLGDVALDWAAMHDAAAAFCDLRGCTMLVLRGDARAGMVRVAAWRGVQEPVQIAQESAHGWRTLLIAGSDGALALRFDGRRYPRTLAALPAPSASELHDAVTLQMWR